MVVGITPDDLSWTFDAEKTMPESLDEALEVATKHRKDTPPVSIPSRPVSSKKP